MSDQRSKLSAQQQTQLENLLLEFDEHWNTKSLQQTLATCHDEPLGYRQAALIELLKIDLERHWSAGGSPILDDYSEALALGEWESEVPTELILAEFVARYESGRKAKASEYRKRYPDQFDDFLKLFEGEKSRRSLLRKSGMDLGKESINPATGTEPQAQTAPHSLPETFGRYKIQKRLGAGAMGAVYLAHDSKLDRQVALKTPTFGGNKNEQMVERFYREARAAANLRNPNICPVFDVGEIDGRHYITMAFIKGRPLSDYVGQTLDQKTVASIIRKLALALAEAHGEGVIHRDLKPANIMVDKKRRPLVMDFGLARREDEGESRMTQSGTIMGTPAYMSPEQVKGDIDEIDAQADVYSLGIILYELLTGQLPFEGSVAAVIGQVLTEAPQPPIEIRHDLDPTLQAICLKMIAKEKSDRYPSMDAVAKDLRAYLKGSPTQATDLPTIEPLPVNEMPVIDGIMDPLALPELGTQAVLPPPAAFQKKQAPPFWKSPALRYTLLGLGSLVIVGLVASLASTLWSGSSDKEETASPIDRVEANSKGVASNDSTVSETLPAKPLSEFDQAQTAQKAYADEIGLPVESTNSVGMAFRLIPPGKFTMGSDVFEAQERPAHSVNLTTPFEIGTFEVSQAQFAKVMGDNASHFKGSKQPVEMVSWADAVEFCKKLSASPEEKSAGYTYRLPTEAEWEYACRAGSSTDLGFGEPAMDFGEIAYFKENAEDQTQPIGRKAPNAWGLFDVYGNVAEWCQDYHAAYASENEVNPTGPADVENQVTARVLIAPFSNSNTTANGSGRTREVEIMVPVDAIKVEIGVIRRGETVTNDFIGMRHSGKYGFINVNGKRIVSCARGHAECKACRSATGETCYDITSHCTPGELVKVTHRHRQISPHLGIAIRFQLAGRVCRGGSFEDDANACRPASRARISPILKSKNIGFRVVRIRGTSNPKSNLEETVEEGSLSQSPLENKNEKLDQPAPKLAIAPFDSNQAKTNRRAWADYLGIPLVSENSVGMKLTVIPPGEFTRGSNDFEENAKPPHRVSLTQAFQLGVHEVTQSQYAEVMESNPSQFKGPSNPVETVSWADAVAFCERLSELPEEKAAGYLYRLPTEAEWEYACRSGTTTGFSYGNDVKKLGEWAWYYNNAKGVTHQVGLKKPNSWGIHDMHGNVWEWCSDRYSEYQPGKQINPTGPSTGENRVFRGGGIRNQYSCRSTFRNQEEPAKVRAGIVKIGFRVVRVAVEPRQEPNREPAVEDDSQIESPSTDSDAALEQAAPALAITPFDFARYMTNSIGIDLKVSLDPDRDGLRAVSATEVTQRQYAEVMGERPWISKQGLEEEEVAASYMTWDDADRFCQRLSEKEGNAYRLPIETEWENMGGGKPFRDPSITEGSSGFHVVMEILPGAETNFDRRNKKLAQIIISSGGHVRSIFGNPIKYRKHYKLEDIKNEDAFYRITAMYLIGFPLPLESQSELGNLRFLTWCALKNVNLKSSGVEALASNSCLGHLNIASNPIGDDDVKYLLELPKLSHLNLSGTRITDASVKFLSQMDNLKELHVSKTRLTTRAIQRLKEAIPDCKIFR